MNLDEFAQRIQDLQQRVAQIQQQASKSSSQQQKLEIIATAFKELSTALEELQVANEELHQQNEELSATHQALEAERQRYQELFEFASDAYLLTDTNGVIQEANPAAAALLNISQTFLIGKPLDIYVVKNERPSFHSKLTELYRVDGVQEWEICLQPLKKKPISAAVKVAAIRNQLGNLVCRRWLLRDITERKQTESQLRQANERWQLATNALNGIIYDWDIETRTVDRTQGLFDVLGYHPEEAEPTLEWWTERIHPDDQQHFRQEISDALANRSNYTIEYRIRHKNNQYLYVWEKGLIIRNARGRAVRVVGSKLDITPRKEAEEEIRFQASLLDAVEQAVIAKDLDGNITYWNQFATKLYGWSRDEAMGRNANSLIVPSFLATEATELNDEITAGSTWSGELQVSRKDGSTFPAQSTGSPLLDAQGRQVGIVCISYDISKRKKSEEVLRTREALLRTVITNAPIILYALDKEGVFTLLEGKGLEPTGVKPGQVVGQSAFEFHQHQPHILEHLRCAFAGTENQWIGEMGEVVYENRATLLRDEKGQVIGLIGVATDITERLRAEAALRESEQRLQAILDNSPVAVYVKDLQGRYLIINRQCERMAHLLTDQIIGKTDHEFLPQAIADRLVANDQQVLATQTPFLQEEEVLMEDGLHTFITVKFPLLDATGVPYAVCGISTDITERKRAEEALQRLNQELENRVRERTAELEQLNEQLIFEIGRRARAEAALRQREQEFRALVENAPDVIERLDRELHHLYVNPAVEKASGKLPTEFIGKTISELGLSEATLSLWEEALRKIFETGQEEQIEFSVVTPNGLKYYQTRFVPEFAKDGKHRPGDPPVSVLGISRDITERKLALEALRESDERFRQLADNINQVFWIASLDPPQKLYVSRAYEKIWGRTCESLYEQPQSWLEAVHPEDRDRVIAAYEKQIEERFDEEYRIVGCEGSIRWIHARTFPIHDEQGRVYRLAGIAEDITCRKQAELEIYKMLQRERELSELKSRFISMTSHEFRTPLTTIQSSAQLLERYRERWSQEKQLTHLNRIQTSVDRMTQMLNDVLIVGKAESGKLEFQPTPIDVVKFCRDLVEELQLTVKNQHKINFTHQGDCSLAVQGPSEGGIGELSHSLPLLDEKLLRQILGNLLSNSIKYSPSRSNIQFDLTCLEDKAIFQIQDQGIGIPSEDLPRLFETFHRARNVGTIQGTGLGLAIVKQCVDLHKGEITIKSEVGKGTTFIVTLPLTNSRPLA